MSATAIKTTNFDAVLASVPNDKTAALVVAQGPKGTSIAEGEQRLADLRRAATATRLEIMAAKEAGRSVISLNERLRDIDGQIVIAKALFQSERRTDPAERAHRRAHAFVRVAARKLSKTLFAEIKLVAEGEALDEE